MKWQGVGGQAVDHPMFVADGTITTGGLCQLALARSICRSFLLIQNTSQGPLWIEFGSARATCTVVAGAVATVTVTNAGQGFSRAPTVSFLGGGGNDGQFANSSYKGLGQSYAAAPHKLARAVANMTGSAPNMSVSTITVEDGGANYLCVPGVFIHDSRLDPYGVAVASATSGILLNAGAPPLVWNGSCCPTDAISIYGDSTAQPYVLRWMD